jgi:hypothetical protein
MCKGRIIFWIPVCANIHIRTMRLILLTKNLPQQKL